MRESGNFGCMEMNDWEFWVREGFSVGLLAC